MEQKPQLPEQLDIPREVRILYWLQFARGKHRREMDFLLHEAKLGKKPRKVPDGQGGSRWEGWNNVIKHNAGEAAAMRVLSHALELPTDQAEKQETMAFIHDAKKHLDVFRRKKQGGDDLSALPPDETFTGDEEEAMERRFGEIHGEVDPDGSLLTATNEEFFYKLFERTPGDTIDEKIANTPQPELLQYYIDSLFDDGKIIPALERIAKAESGRGAKLNDDPERTRRLGMKYWDAERLAATKVQQLIWKQLREKGVELPSPDTLPDFLRKKIEQEMVEYWIAVHGRTHVETIRDQKEGESPYRVEVLSETRRKNPEDNEDQGVVREEKGVVLAGVFDGATTIADIPYFRELRKTPGNVASTVCKAILKSLPMNTAPKDALMAMNKTLRSVLGAMPLSPEQKAELLTMGLVVRREGKKVQYANVGDTTLVKIAADGSVTFLTDDRVEPFEMDEYRAAQEDAARLGIPVSEVLKREDSHCWEVINVNRARENDPEGKTYGVLKGGDDAVIEQYIQSGEIELREGESLLLYTDGLTLPVSVPRENRRAFIEQAIRSGGLNGLVGAVRAEEEQDADCTKYLRLKQHDDATGVLIN